MAVFVAQCPLGHQHFGFFPTSYGVTARLVSCRLKEIDGFFARNNEEYLALIFEKKGSYLGREVSCPQGPCNSWIALGGEPSELRSRLSPKFLGLIHVSLMNPARA